jgi:hypothetical protein
MAEFSKALLALTEGHCVQRERWEPTIRLFVSGNSLMWQRGNAKPWRCALSWDELAATDWRVYVHATAVPRLNRTPVGFSMPFRTPAQVLGDSLNEATARRESHIVTLNDEHLES